MILVKREGRQREYAGNYHSQLVTASLERQFIEETTKISERNQFHMGDLPLTETPLNSITLTRFT